MYDQAADTRLKVHTGHEVPRVWTVFVALAVAFVLLFAFQIVLGIALAFYEISRGSNQQQLAQRITELLTTPLMFMMLTTCSQLAFLVVSLGAAYLSGASLLHRLAIRPTPQRWTFYPLVMLGSIVPTAIGFGFAYALALIVPADGSVAMLYNNITIATAIPFVLFIALVPGLCEELMFRGYIQVRLLQRWKPATAIGVSSALFALAHIAPHTIVFAFPIGIWLGIVAWRTGSILPTIACHAFINGSVNALRLIAKFGEFGETTQLVIQLGYLALGIIAFLITCRILAEPMVQPQQMPSQPDQSLEPVSAAPAVPVWWTDNAMNENH